MSDEPINLTVKALDAADVEQTVREKLLPVLEGAVGGVYTRPQLTGGADPPEAVLQAMKLDPVLFATTYFPEVQAWQLEEIRKRLGHPVRDIQLVVSPADLEALRRDEKLTAAFEELTRRIRASIPILTSGFLPMHRAFVLAAQRAEELAVRTRQLEELQLAPAFEQDRLMFRYRHLFDFTVAPGWNPYLNLAAYGDDARHSWPRLPRKLKKALRNRWQRTLRGRRELACVRRYFARKGHR